MNSSIIRFILGYVLKIEALLLLLPCLVAVIYREREGLYFFLVALCCLLLGWLMTYKKPSSYVFYLKEGCMSTTLSWIFLSFFGCLPFWFSREIPSFTDALFETVSGFTATGASILSDIEALSRCMVFWRSFTNWIGGMGVLVFLLAIIPLSGGSNINLMRTETPGPSVGKLVPKVKYSVRILYLIYVGITVLEIILLVAGGLPFFDAVTTSFATAGTGGFCIRNDSMVSYSPYLQWVVIIFMILCGVNFNSYYYILLHHFKKAFRMEEVKYYFLIILVSVCIIFCNILDLSDGAFDALTKSVFQVGSIMTTAGFYITDFNLWPQTSRSILVLLMFIGACAGSTGGGIKVSRLVILFKTLIKELNSYIHPKSIKKIKFEGKPVEHDVVRSINVYFITFMILFSLSIFAVSFEGKDLVTTFTAVTAAINNIGPGLEGVGPTQNFSSFGCFSKFVLMFDMLAGRLELFPLLILFHPAVWKDLFASKVRCRKKDPEA